MATKTASFELPTFSVYGNYSGNYGAHALKFTDAEGNTFYFSYTTLVAFHHAKSGATIVHTNDWAQTTGKHLNAIDGGDKKARLSDDAFKAKFAELFGRSQP